MESLEVLSAREEEIGREWERLHQVINSVAQVRAENRNVQTFRILQEQCRIAIAPDQYTAKMVNS